MTAASHSASDIWPSVHKLKLHHLRNFFLSGTAVSPRRLKGLPRRAYFERLTSSQKQRHPCQVRELQATPHHRPTQTRTTNNETNRAKQRPPRLPPNDLLRWLQGGQPVQTVTAPIPAAVRKWKWRLPWLHEESGTCCQSIPSLWRTHNPICSPTSWY